MTTVTIVEQVVAVTAVENDVTVTVTETPIEISVSPGVTAFLALTDTPDTYAGQAGKVAAVNSGATALEFVAAGVPLLSKTAGETLGGHRAVWIDADDKAYYADRAALSADRVAGLTTGAAALAAAATIQTGGELTEPTWAWAPGPVWLGTTGALTQTPPTSGRLTQLGVATTPTKVVVRIEPAIQVL